MNYMEKQLSTPHWFLNLPGEWRTPIYIKITSVCRAESNLEALKTISQKAAAFTGLWMSTVISLRERELPVSLAVNFIGNICRKDKEIKWRFLRMETLKLHLLAVLIQMNPKPHCSIILRKTEKPIPSPGLHCGRSPLHSQLHSRNLGRAPLIPQLH